MPGWKLQAKQFGVVSSRSLTKAAGDLVPPEEKQIMAHRKKENADICLSCTKSASQCYGGDRCFMKRKKELEGKGEDK